MFHPVTCKIIQSDRSVIQNSIIVQVTRKNSFDGKYFLLIIKFSSSLPSFKQQAKPKKCINKLHIKMQEFTTLYCMMYQYKHRPCDQGSDYGNGWRQTAQKISTHDLTRSIQH